MTNDSTRIGLVFSGGGSRGAYQIGVWQALNQLNISNYITAAYGTSVGAINSAAFIQGDLDLALNIWNQLDYRKVFNNFPKDNFSISNRKKYIEWIKGSIVNRGLDVSPLKSIIRESISETAIRNSALDFGLVVFNLTERKPAYLTKSEIPEDQLIEYIIASATFPVFQPHKIDDITFLDGGLYDNRPLGFFNEHQSINKIIMVDVTIARHFWPNKKIHGDLETYYVRPSRLLGSPMAFQKSRIKANMTLGYHDAMEQLSTFTM